MKVVLEILVCALLVGVELFVVALIVAPKAVLRRVRDLALRSWRGATEPLRRLDDGRRRSAGSPDLSRS